MRTSLNSTKAIDDYLLGSMALGDSALFEANMLFNSGLRDDVAYQQRTYSLINEYGRQHIRAEIAAVREALATAPQHQGFMNRIAHIFKKS